MCIEGWPSFVLNDGRQKLYADVGLGIIAAQSGIIAGAAGPGFQSRLPSAPVFGLLGPNGYSGLDSQSGLEMGCDDELLVLAAAATEACGNFLRSRYPLAAKNAVELSLHRCNRWHQFKKWRRSIVYLHHDGCEYERRKSRCCVGRIRCLSAAGRYVIFAN